MNLDPKCAADYLRHVGIGKPRVVDGIMAKLGEPASDINDGLDTHLLRTMSTKPRGRAEGRVFEKIAEDRSRRPAVRSWAYQALKRTPLWKPGRAIEAARAESNPHVQRAIVVTLKGSSGPTYGKFLAHVDAQLPELKYTRRWLDAG